MKMSIASIASIISCFCFLLLLGGLLLLTACIGRQRQPTAAFQANEPILVAGHLDHLPDTGDWIVIWERESIFFLLNVESGERYRLQTRHLTAEERIAARHLPHIKVGNHSITTDGGHFVDAAPTGQQIESESGVHSISGWIMPVPHNGGEVAQVYQDDGLLFFWRPDEATLWRQVAADPLPRGRFNPRLSPGGQWILHIGKEMGSDQAKLFAVQLPAGPAQKLLELEEAANDSAEYVVAADGRFILVKQARHLLYVNADTGESRPLLEIEPQEWPIQGYTLLPDGQTVYVALRQELLALNAQDGSRRLIKRIEPDEGQFLNLTASPDGRQIVVWRVVSSECRPYYVEFQDRGDQCRRDFFVIDAADGRERRLTVGLLYHYEFVWWRPGGDE